MIARDAANDQHNARAPWLTVPAQSFVSVEHPGIVKDIGNVITSLGGIAKLGIFAAAGNANRSLSLNLTPGDAFRKPLTSRPVQTANIALKITVPKLTGRKRKRGSAEPFVFHPAEEQLRGEDVFMNTLKHFRHDPMAVEIEPIGFVEEVHRFRDMPDFQYSLADSSLVQNLRSSLLRPHYHSLNRFSLDTTTKGVQPWMAMIPPPSFSQSRAQYNYAYRQNPNVKLEHDASGKQTSVNSKLLPRTATQLCSFDVASVPHGPGSSLPSEDSLEPRLQELLTRVRQLFETRPIHTRRALINYFGRNFEYDLKCVMQYVAYMLRSGPWKDAYIKYGLDPRTDVTYRIYQTLSFQIVVKDESMRWADGRVKWSRSLKEKQASIQSHVFDGEHLTADGKIWQACDITDPLIRSILDEDHLRSTCDIKRDGWYNNGTWAKARTIMRDMITVIISGQKPVRSEYTKLCQIPNVLDDNTSLLALSTKDFTTKEQILAAQIRGIARSTELQEKKLARLDLNQRAGTYAMVDQETRGSQREEEIHGLQLNVPGAELREEAEPEESEEEEDEDEGEAEDSREDTKATSPETNSSGENSAENSDG